MSKLLAVGIVLVLFSGVPALQAWGSDGHRITGAIAWHLLTPEAVREVESLLESGPYDSLAEVGTWADSHARQYDSYDWALPLHYVDVDPEAGDIDLARDCPKGECIIAAIRRLSVLVADRALPQWERAEHFRFLVHFIEDIHQPLHVVHPDDQGGNRTKVTLFGRQTNLHSVWDSRLIRHRLEDYPSNFWRRSEPWKQWAKALRGDISLADIEAWGGVTDPLAWACEALAPSRELTFEVQSGDTLGDTYYRAVLPTIDVQLRKAGVRLAATLNRVFAESR
jgi:hypothetical protein